MGTKDVKPADDDTWEQVKMDGPVSQMDHERRKQVEKKLKMKLDLRCSFFVIIYIMNYLDRNNIAAARLGGLQEDLGINNTQYATCLSICEFLRYVAILMYRGY
jgi:hypothetical protein